MGVFLLEGSEVRVRGTKVVCNRGGLTIFLEVDEIRIRYSASEFGFGSWSLLGLRGGSGLEVALEGVDLGSDIVALVGEEGG